MYRPCGARLFLPFRVSVSLKRVIMSVSYRPSKIPYGGFSPVRLQATVRFRQCVPSGCPFERTFADSGLRDPYGSHAPGLFARLIVGRSSPSVISHRCPRVLCSEQVILSRSSSLLRPDPPVCRAARFRPLGFMPLWPSCDRPSLLSPSHFRGVPSSIRRRACRDFPAIRIGSFRLPRRKNGSPPSVPPLPAMLGG
jgi:hypothetical protein